MPVSHLKMQQINPYLYHFSCIVDHKEINTKCCNPIKIKEV